MDNASFKYGDFTSPRYKGVPALIAMCPEFAYQCTMVPLSTQITNNLRTLTQRAEILICTVRIPILAFCRDGVGYPKQQTGIGFPITGCWRYFHVIPFM